MKIMFIINPAAGKGKAIKTWRNIKRRIDDFGLDYVYRFTTGPRDATLISKAAVFEEYDIVAVLGGDGTLQEAVNGLAGSETCLAVLPGGTGNDFAKSLKISNDIEKIIEPLINPVKKR